MKIVLCLTSLLLYGIAISAQKPVGDSVPLVPSREAAALLTLGPGDLVRVTVYQMPELDQRLRVSDQGTLNLSLIGELKVAGMTADELGREIATRLRDGQFVKRPSVNIFVEEYTTQGVAVVGEVAKPGIVPIYSSHSLLDILSASGGLKDTASTEILIRRRGQAADPEKVQLGRDGQSFSGSIVDVSPGDQVIVPQAGIVYLLGDLHRPGGYTMSDNGTISLLQAMAMAGGTTRTASENHTRLIRATPGGYEDRTISLKDIMKGKQKDFPLHSRDIIYVPFSNVKHALLGTQSILGAATSASIIR